MIMRLFSAKRLLKRKGARGGNPKAPLPPNGPELCTAGAKLKGWMMNSTPDLLELSGRARIRAMFHPRQRVGLIEAGKVLGKSYPQLHRRIQQGKLALRVQRDEFGQMFVAIDDLAAYLYPDEQSSQPSLPPAPAVSAKRLGRPRKTEGGAR